MGERRVAPQALADSAHTRHEKIFDRGKDVTQQTG
jgi:hypothetical protein